MENSTNVLFPIARSVLRFFLPSSIFRPLKKINPIVIAVYPFCYLLRRSYIQSAAATATAARLVSPAPYVSVAPSRVTYFVRLALNM